MIDDYKLFSSMIKYHAAIVGWLIKEKKAEQLDDRLIVYQDTEDVNIPTYSKEYTGKVYEILSDGTKKMPLFKTISPPIISRGIFMRHQWYFSSKSQVHNFGLSSRTRMLPVPTH